MARPRQFVVFPDFFKGFEHLPWSAKSQKHKEYAEANRTVPKGQKDERRFSDSYQFESAMRGCWLVKCDYITDQWEDNDLRLRVNVKAGVGGQSCLTGLFDWGVLEGVMQFHRQLSQLPHVRSAGADGHVSEDSGRSQGSEDPEDAEDGPSENEEDIPATREQVTRLADRLKSTERLLEKVVDTLSTESTFKAAHQRMQEIAQTHAAKPENQKRKLANSDGQTTTKKARTAETHPRRLYFLWRGRETGEGEIQLDHDRSNRGWIEFTDDNCLEFHGVINGGFLGENVKWSGYKVGGSSAPFRRAWNDYSEEQYDHESIARWR